MGSVVYTEWLEFILYASLFVEDAAIANSWKQHSLIVRVCARSSNACGIGVCEIGNGRAHAEREELEQAFSVREVGTRARGHQLQQRLHQQSAAQAHCEPLDRQPLRLIPGRELVHVIHRLQAAFIYAIQSSISSP